MTRLALFLLACSDGIAMHPPDLGCQRVPVAVYEAGGDCVLLEDANGRALFRLSTSESCGGPPCLLLLPGEVGYALELSYPGEPARWTVGRGSCEELEGC